MTAALAVPGIEVDRDVPRPAMAEFLAADRLFSAYALADLDPVNAGGARWWLARRGDAPVAGAVIMVDLTFRPLFVVGDAEGAGQLLRHAVREARVIVSGPAELRPVIESVYRLERVDRMLRMAVDPGTFVPSDGYRPRRLRPADLDDVIDLYGLASRTYFTPRRLEQEIYFGLFDGATLVAAAGTHLRSREFGIAAVGNVLTRPDYRNRGMARACTAAVTAACFEDGHRDVVLNVRDDNAPAIAVYRRLGFDVHRTFIESVGYRRPAWERMVQNIFRGENA